MQGKIERSDRTGHTLVAQYDTQAPATLQVAQEELDRFLADCVQRYGSEPPVWARRAGMTEYEVYDPSAGLATYDAVLLQYPIVGG